MFRSATAQMLPPLPPSPPSGPPKGRNFSRQKEATPLPPSPAMTSIFASSMNFMICAAQKLKRPYRRQSLFDEGLRLIGCVFCRLRRYYGNRMTLQRALGCKLHLAVDQREQGVILAHADVVTSVHLGAALTDDDAAGVDRLAAVDFHAQSF